jgi:spermidine synthase
LRRDRLLLLAFFLSGVAALGYEILWTRLLSLTLGSETLGILGTLAGFFGGLAVGSFALHERVRRSADPARLFAVFEAIAAVYALCSPHLLHTLARTLPPLLGPAAGDNDTPLALLLSLGTAVLVLLPATVPMGATLAALVEARRRALTDRAEGTGLGRLYGVNTLGATAGVLAAVHLILPGFGMTFGSAILAALGLLAAGLAMLWARGFDLRVPEAADVEGRPGARRLYLLLFGTGLAGVGLEVAGVQVLAQVLEDTVYTFADILAVYLLGTAAGAWIFGRFADKAARRGAHEVTATLLAAHALSVMLAAVALWFAPSVLQALAPSDAGRGARMAAELVLAALVFLLPTLLMGALASHLLAQAADRGVGRAYGFNTLGATLSPFVFGLAGIPLLGYEGAFYLAGWLYLALFGLVAAGRGWNPVRTWGAAAAVLAAWMLTPVHLRLVEVEEGWRVVADRETLMGLVRVTERIGSEPPMRRLQVNTYFREGGGTAFGERRMGHLPLLLAPEARTALFLGTSTGSTLGTVRHYPLERITGVEIVPEIVELMPHFAHINGGVEHDPRVRIHTADARRFVAASRDRYDVVVADLFHPAKDGAGTLYSREHFEGVRDHLAPGGLFAQWLPLHQFDERNLKTVIRTFLSVFPEVHSFLGIYNVETPALVLLGKADGRLTIPLNLLRQQLRRPVYAEVLMQDARDLLGAYMLDRETLARYAGQGPLNTDFNPRVLFDAPESAYANRQDLAYGSLLSLLPERTLYPQGLVTGADPARLADVRRHVTGFSKALGYYMRAEVARYAAGEGAPVPSEARAQYLLAYEAAPDFRPAVDLLVALASLEPQSAEGIYRRMLARSPDRSLPIYRVWLRGLEQAGERVRYNAVLREARERLGTGAL